MSAAVGEELFARLARAAPDDAERDLYYDETSATWDVDALASDLAFYESAPLPDPSTQQPQPQHMPLPSSGPHAAASVKPAAHQPTHQPTVASLPPPPPPPQQHLYQPPQQPQQPLAPPVRSPEPSFEQMLNSAIDLNAPPAPDAAQMPAAPQAYPPTFSSPPVGGGAAAVSSGTPYSDAPTSGQSWKTITAGGVTSPPMCSSMGAAVASALPSQGLHPEAPLMGGVDALATARHGSSLRPGVFDGPGSELAPSCGGVCAAAHSAQPPQPGVYGCIQQPPPADAEGREGSLTPSGSGGWLVNLVEGKIGRDEAMQKGKALLTSWLGTSEAAEAPPETPAYVYNAEIKAWLPSNMSPAEWLKQEAEQKRQEEAVANIAPPPIDAMPSAPSGGGLAPAATPPIGAPPRNAPPAPPAGAPPMGGAPTAGPPSTGTSLGYRSNRGSRVSLSDHYRTQAGEY